MAEVWFGGVASHIMSALLVACLVCSSQINAQSPKLQPAITCLSQGEVSNFSTASSAAFADFLDSSLQNLRFAEAGELKPDIIIFPKSTAEVQRAFLCSINEGYRVRVRSGGHSYEGLSSTADAPFVIIDLMRMHTVTVDLVSKTTWAEAGATLGEIYYGISQLTPDYGFPAGVCPTVGSSGHFSGGGYGFLSRKYGTASDNVIDAQLINANGQLLDRHSMGEDLFWALRGGGGGSWGIVVAWRIQLVPVTATVTTFRLWKTGKQNMTELIYRWQAVAPAAPEELFHAVYFAGINVTGTNSTSTTDVGASFYGQYLGTQTETLALMSRIFPELGLSAADCEEGSWVEGVASIASVASPAALTSRNNSDKGYFKAKSDYVKEQLSIEALSGAMDLLEANPGKGYMIFEPYGGVMEQIAANATAFPHRAGVLYNIQYQAVWSNDEGGAVDAPLLNWLQNLYEYMTPFVSQSPRAAYVNYIDLDLGVDASYEGALASWGQDYFRSNFPRLAQIKARIDQNNIFSYPQSVPPVG